MSFSFLNKITSVNDKRITGRVDFSVNDRWRLEGPSGQVVINPNCLLEAIVQLGSWKVFHDSDFQFRLDDVAGLKRFEIFAPVIAPCSVELEATVSSPDEALRVLISGNAKINGKRVFEVENAVAREPFTVSTKADVQFEPKETRRIFDALVSQGISRDADGEPFNLAAFIESAADVKLGQHAIVRTPASPQKRVELFQFPEQTRTRKMRVPVSIFNELATQASLRVLSPDPAQPQNFTLRSAHNLNFGPSWEHKKLIFDGFIVHCEYLDSLDDEVEIGVSILQDGKIVFLEQEVDEAWAKGKGIDWAKWSGIPLIKRRKMMDSGWGRPPRVKLRKLIEASGHYPLYAFEEKTNCHVQDYLQEVRENRCGTYCFRRSKA